MRVAPFTLQIAHLRHIIKTIKDYGGIIKTVLFWIGVWMLSVLVVLMDGIAWWIDGFRGARW